MPNTFIRSSSRVRRLFWPASLAGAVALGVLSTAWLSGRPEYEVRDLGQPARAELGNNPSADTSPGDERIMWTSLPSSLHSPLVVDGNDVWVAVAERLSDAGPFESGVYLYSAHQAELRRVATVEGRPTAAVLTPKGLAVGVGQRIVLVGRTGTTRTLTLADRPTLEQGIAPHITSLAHLNGRLFVSTEGSAVVEELDIDSGATVRTFPLGSVPTPQTLVVVDSATLLASTPFGVVNGPGPVSVELDLNDGSTRAVSLGKPFGFSKDASGRLFTTQSVPGGGVREIARESGAGALAARSAEATSIPWNGRWDLLTVSPDSSIWGAVQGTGRIFRQRATGELDEYALPTLRGTPSFPGGGEVTKEDEVRLSQVVRNVTSMVSLSDGSLVFFSDSPGGALGYIPAR